MEVSEGRPYLVWDQPAVVSRALRVQVGPGQLYLVGDNRDRSGDSRSFGPVSVTAVRGRVRSRVWPVVTNRVDRAPLKARQAAYQRCSRRPR
jgi:type IV secretory pathway protease TraF